MAWQEFPIKYGHAPDLNRSDENYWSIVGAVPLSHGFGTEHAYTASTNGTMVGSGEVNACAELFTTNGTRRVMFGSLAKLWSWDGVINNATTERSGTTYGATTAQSWSFAQFGDNTLAVCKAAKVQRWTGTGNFADAATAAPKGSIIVNCGFPTAPQLMVFDYNDGTDYPDGWYCSALSSDTDWVNSVATGSASGRLLEPTGPITCAIPFRDGVVAFKKNAMFYGEYVGGDTVWSWRRLSSAIGCIGKNAAVASGDLIYFAATDGFYKFDGSYPQKLPGFVHLDWAYTISSITTQSVRDRVCAVADNTRGIVRWTYVSSVSSNSGNGYCYNARSGLWTRWKAEPLAVGALANSGAVWGSYEYCAGNDGSTRKQDTALRCIANFDTPRFGNPQVGATLRGVWPMWKPLSNAVLGPQNSGWTTGLAGSVAFYAYVAPETSPVTPATTSNAVANNIGYATGMVTGRWVEASLDIYMASYNWEFQSVAIDITRNQQL